MLARFLTVLFTAACLSSASATTIIFSSSIGGRSAFDSSLTALPNGDLFMVGTFSNVGGITLGSTVAAVLASGGWAQFAASAAANTTSTLGGNPGKLSGQAQDNSSLTAAPFDFQNLYLVVVNAPTVSAATQVGIFRAPTISVGTDAWAFPKNAGGGTDQITISMNETSMAAIGGVGSTTNVSPLRFILTSVVPEPSSALLLGFGIIGMLGHRRLRRNF